MVYIIYTNVFDTFDMFSNFIYIDQSSQFFLSFWAKNIKSTPVQWPNNRCFMLSGVISAVHLSVLLLNKSWMETVF